jgi:uroporphyrin-III C-methyltransferase
LATTEAVATTLAAPAQSWLQRHERIIIVALVLLAGSWGYSRYADNAASKAEARATIAEQTLATQKAQDAQNQAQIVQLTQQYQQLTQVLATQNASLAASIASRQTVQAAQVATDAHLAPSALATRLATLANTPVEEVSVTPTGLALTEQAAVTVTETLEAIPVLQADLKDTQATLQTSEATVAKANDLIAEQTKQIAALNTTLSDTVKADAAELKAVKAEARKSKAKWFKIGSIVGFITGMYVGHAIP